MFGLVYISLYAAYCVHEIKCQNSKQLQNELFME